MKKITLLLLASLFVISSCQNTVKQDVDDLYDVCIYGGTSAGVVAAFTASQLGKKVILVSPTQHLGGLSSSGLGSTDIGNKYAVQGLARKFYRDLGTHYGNFENWTFEPKVAEALFEKMVTDGGFEVVRNKRIIGLEKEGATIRNISLEDGKDTNAATLNVNAKQFIDCTYEGDLMAKAGVSYFIGREDNKVYNETLSGVQLRNKHQFPDGIDPYIVEGDSTSGLLPTINPEPVKPNGTGDKMVQAYNYRLCLTNDSTNRIPFPEPTNYDPINYELLWRVMKKNMNLDDDGNVIAGAESNEKKYDHYWQWRSFKTGFIIQYMPNEKTDFNHLGGFSIDYIGQNHHYPEASYKERAQIFEEHTQFILGIFHFLKTDPRIPEKIKEDAQTWGLPKDEFVDNGGWPYYLYVRETRRMIGEYVMTEHNCVGDEKVEDGIGLAAYTMDSHNCQRVVVNGMVKNEGNVEVGGFGPYPIAYRSLTPKREECTNLLVPVCLSASHIAYGSIRMEPVFMVLAQISAMAASQAIENNSSVQTVDVPKIVSEFEKNPYLNNTRPDIIADDGFHNLIQSSPDVERAAAFMIANDTSYLYSEKTNSDSKIQFAINAYGKYDVRFFIPKFKGRKSVALPDSSLVEVKIGEEVFQSTIPVNSEKGKMVLVGTYDFQQGEEASVTTIPQNIGDPLVGDAIVLVPND